jgi:hypothetical protein
VLKAGASAATVAGLHGWCLITSMNML